MLQSALEDKLAHVMAGARRVRLQQLADLRRYQGWPHYRSVLPGILLH